MKENVGTIDRIARAAAGSVLLGLGYTRWGGREGELKGIAAMLGAATLLESAVTRVCPLNALFGRDTRRPELVEKDLHEAIKHAHQLGYAPHVQELTQHL